MWERRRYIVGFNTVAMEGQEIVVTNQTLSQQKKLTLKNAKFIRLRIDGHAQRISKHIYILVSRQHCGRVFDSKNVFIFIVNF